MTATKPAIWIDVDNSPHVPLFAPIVRYFSGQGIDVILTARDHSQTIELLKLHGFEGLFTVVGRHYGKVKLAKIGGALVRAKQLASYIRKQNRPAVAISHGSRSAVIAARWLKIPVLTMYDYEFTETSIFNRLSTKVLVPDRIPDEALDEIGLPKSKRVKYPGIKEELYLHHFEPEPNFRQTFLTELAAPHAADKIIAVVRPPAMSANYHSATSDVLLDDLMQFLAEASNVFTVVVPRTKEQSAAIDSSIRSRSYAGERVNLLDRAIDGLNLVNTADLLISGGGTMNREGALLGVPVYSIFAGRQGALDRQMEAEGLITFIRDARDLSKIRLERRVHGVTDNRLTDRVERFVIDEINAFLDMG